MYKYSLLIQPLQYLQIMGKKGLSDYRKPTVYQDANHQIA